MAVIHHGHPLLWVPGSRPRRPAATSVTDHWRRGKSGVGGRRAESADRRLPWASHLRPVGVGRQSNAGVFLRAKYQDSDRDDRLNGHRPTSVFTCRVTKSAGLLRELNATSSSLVYLQQQNIITTHDLQRNNALTTRRRSHLN